MCMCACVGVEVLYSEGIYRREKDGRKLVITLPLHKGRNGGAIPL